MHLISYLKLMKDPLTLQVHAILLTFYIIIIKLTLHFCHLYSHIFIKLIKIKIQL